MKITITESMFRDQFRQVRPNNFSRDGLSALWTHFSDLEQVNGGELELDVIAICCDWTEYANVIEAAEAYGFKADESEDERADRSDHQALEFLRDETWVLETDGASVVVHNF